MTAAFRRATTLAPSLDAAAIGHAAAMALYEELALAPKPGLVSFEDAGSHDDMDANTFMRSLFILRPYFAAIATLGMVHAPFADLERLGIAAEQDMLRATGGVNTHRGAIFSLGLLCAAAGVVVQEGGAATPARVRAALTRHWGIALAARAHRHSDLPGGRAARLHGLRSASQEAAAGFPTIFEVAVPVWRKARARGLDASATRLETLFAVMALLDDCNVAHRGGRKALDYVQAAAHQFFALGGAATAAGYAHAQAMHHECMARRLSPGGAADTLAAACLLARLESGYRR